MNPPFLRHAPDIAAVPLVIDSPHSGEDYPADFEHLPPRAIVRHAEDTHVARLYRSATRSGATLIEATFPRAYIDPNRSLADLDPSMLAGPWPDPIVSSRKTEQGIGLIWRVARDGMPMYGRALAVADVRRRIDGYYVPYHAALASELDRLHRAFGAVWHIDAHSMPAIGDANADDPGRERADVVLGDREGTTCAPEFTALVGDFFRGAGYSVAINDPYKGVEIVRKHGRPGEGRHSLQIELNRRLYMDEATLLPNAHYAQLEADLRGLIGATARFTLERVTIGKTT